MINWKFENFNNTYVETEGTLDQIFLIFETKLYYYNEIILYKFYSLKLVDMTDTEIHLFGIRGLENFM